AVGDDQRLTGPQVQQLSLAIRRRVSFEVSRGGDPVITLKVSPDETAQSQFLMRDDGDADAQKELAQDILEALEGLARLETTSAGVLYADFAAACPNDVQLAQYLERLGQAAITRGPSSTYAGAGQPAERFLLVGSPAISVRVSNLLNAANIPNAASLARLTAGLVNNGTQLAPMVCPSIGESVMLLEVWGAGESRKLDEYNNSLGVYYNLGHNVDRAQVPQRYSAANFPFHLIPELDTASHIETAARFDEPLAIQIVQGLRGPDPRMLGPTNLLLFYLARVH